MSLLEIAARLGAYAFVFVIILTVVISEPGKDPQ